MDWTFLTGALALFTLLAVVVIAYTSKRRTEQRKNNPAAEKSTLAKDKSSDGKPADV